MKWGLGQYSSGDDYGVSNDRGKTSRTDVGRILKQAYDAGFRMIDTAPGYGNSEEVLGEFLPQFPDLRVITKTVSWNGSDFGTLATHFREGLQASLHRLGRAQTDGVLLHQPSLLKEHGPIVAKALQSLREAGLTRCIGVSIYEASEIDYCLTLFKPDVIQVPINLFDQRLLNSGHLAKLKAQGIEVIARSVFLQGLLLMERHEIPAALKKWSDHFDRYDRFLKDQRVTRLQAALGFIASQRLIDTALIGVCAPAELTEILAVLTTLSPDVSGFESVAAREETLVNPSRWENREIRSP